jgi:hypothetical protein
MRLTRHACDKAPKERFEFPYQEVDLNQNFGATFRNEEFDAVCLVEVIEHPRHIFRQIKPLLKREGLFS